MADKIESKTPQSKDNDALANPFAQLQDAGFGKMLGMGTTVLEALSDMNAEIVGFVADRIKADVKTQHEILHCKNVSDLQDIQAKFIQNAVDQYQAETGKLVEMSTKIFQTDTDTKS